MPMVTTQMVNMHWLNSRESRALSHPCTFTSPKMNLFFVLKGQLRIFRGTEEHVINAGESLFLPRRIPHTFKVLSGSVRGLVLITPVGFEDYFREIGTPASPSDTPPPFVVDVPRMTRVAAQFGVEFVK
jgi:hypothetical protein